VLKYVAILQRVNCRLEQNVLLVVAVTIVRYAFCIKYYVTEKIWYKYVYYKYIYSIS
jgi:hypothetical protein